MLSHRQEIGQDLRGMELIGEAVPHGNAGEFGQFLHGGLREAAVLDAVVHPPQHAGRVLHRLLDADLAARGPQIGDVGALVVGRHLEGAARAGGRLFEDEGDVAALEVLHFPAGFFIGLELSGQIQQILNFCGRKVQQFEEASVS